MAGDLAPSTAPVDEEGEPAPAPAPAKSSALGTYQPGLDGMRGLATLCVLGYHAEIAWTRGAFLALSQFFTLSGFLITGVLLRNHVRPGGRLGPFWTRRIRRLMPAAVIALFFVALYGATVATRQQADALPGDITAAATWTANWHFILSGRSYVNLFAAPSPVQHFWSLAIEEQFYLFLPILLVLVVRRTDSPRIRFAVVGTVALLSTAWMIALYDGGATLDRLYYGTDTRMAELLVGAALAVVIAHTGFDFSDRARNILAAIGVACFAITIWCWVNIRLADGAVWRGGFLVYSLLSCGVILGILAGRAPLTPLMSLRPLVYVGRISYGLYLYHFPVFLWLTEERTGLSRWPLFVLRFGVTFALAILSYRLLEQPVMRGASFGLGRIGRIVVVPAALVLVVVLTITTVNASAPDPLATLPAGALPGAMPTAADDGVLDVLVIPPRAGDPVVEELRRSMRADESAKLTIADPFRCEGGLVAVNGGRTCANWARTWPSLVRRSDPDAVILYADDWAGEPLATLGPPGQEAATAEDALSAGFDLLTAGGAPVIWASSGASFADAYRRAQRPFSQAMSRLPARRSDVFKVVGTEMPDPATVTEAEFRSQSARALLEDAGLHQRGQDQGLPRVMIVGDSQSESLGYGLERWSAQNNRALVWNRGTEGCGVVVAGSIRSFGAAGSELERCRATARAWPRQVKAFDPDVVVVLSSITDVQDRRLPGSSIYRSVGDPKFDAFLVEQYEQVVDTLSATGARVVWMTPPCTALKATLGQEAPFDATQVSHLNTKILPKVARARPDTLVRFDLDRLICPDGEPLRSLPGVGELRPDGIHFSVAGARWFARTYGDKVLQAGGI